MTIQDIRRENLTRLVEQYGSQRKLSDATGLAPTYIHQMLSSIRGIGEKTARKIEINTGLPDGWLDKPFDISGDYQLTEDEMRLIDMYRSAPDIMKQAILSVAQASSSQVDKEIDKAG